MAQAPTQADSQNGTRCHAHRHHPVWAPVPTAGRPMVFATLSGLGLLVILFTWLFGGEEQGLGFSEAEIKKVVWDNPIAFFKQSGRLGASLK